jgi:flotillin
MSMGLMIWAGVVVVVVVLIFLLLSKQYQKVGPNEVLVISGGKKRTVADPDGTKRTIGYRTCVGGGTFVMPFLETTQTLSLEVFTIAMKTPEVPTAQGVPVIAEAVAQVKVTGDDYSVRQAVEQFLGKGTDAMRDVAGQVLEGHFRAALGTMSIEEICGKRGEFAQRVQSTASRDLGGMGLMLLSFALKDITDTQGYIEALGKPQVAAVKRDAVVAEAEASRDATINSAGARKEGDVAKLKADTEIAQANRDYEAKRAEFQTVINQRKAQADFAYDLERHKMNQQIKKEEYKTKLVEKLLERKRNLNPLSRSQQRQKGSGCLKKPRRKSRRRDSQECRR